MSMISEQVKELRELAENPKIDMYGILSLQNVCRQAADTIESLSAKLQSTNMERSERYYNGGWIPCSERLPEENINPITEDFYEYQVTFKSGDVRDIRHYKFGKGHWWDFGENMDRYVIAWQPKPEPYKPQ